MVFSIEVNFDTKTTNNLFKCLITTIEQIINDFELGHRCPNSILLQTYSQVYYSFQ